MVGFFYGRIFHRVARKRDLVWQERIIPKRITNANLNFNPDGVPHGEKK